MSAAIVHTSSVLGNHQRSPPPKMFTARPASSIVVLSRATLRIRIGQNDILSFTL